MRVADRGPGTVLYEARNVRTDRQVHIELLVVGAEDDADARRRFLREAKLAAHLTHGNIINVYDMGETGSGSLYVVQERVDGESLSRYLRRVGPLPLSEAADIVLSLMDALSAAHAAGIIHGSVTTEQVRLVELNSLRRIPKLLDLGLAWQLGREGITRLTVGVRPDGGPPLVAPELLKHDRVTDPRVDVWGICAVLFHCLTGRLPFDATSPRRLSRQLLTEDAPLVSSVRSGIHSRVDAYLAKGLAREPADRFVDMREASIELRSIVEEIGDSTVEWEERPTDTWRAAPRASRDAAPSEPIRYGVLVPGQVRDSDGIATALREAIGRPCDVVGYSGYSELVDAIGEGEVDLACLPPVAYVRSQLGGGALLLLGVERAGRLGYASALLGRTGVVDTIEQVRGKRAAWVDKWSAAGYLAPRAALVERGIDPDRELASQGFLGSYDAVLEALTDGTAHVGAAYCSVGAKGHLARSAWSKDHPVTVLAVRGPIPGEVICGRPDLDVKLAMRTVRGLTDPKRGERLREVLGVSRFLMTDPKAYESLTDAF
ncbi:MAG: PhnD/SsuA/transferrin family substrate-binding protein [Sandaracinaceae bacterium]|nr:PhnD/SsuA/transferrin family substrate-binding protein [Sandaracinaceae bacterium]